MIRNPKILSVLAAAWAANVRLKAEIARANRLCHAALPSSAALASSPPPSKGRDGASKKSLGVTAPSVAL